jgi:hypothetical protein
MNFHQKLLDPEHQAKNMVKEYREIFAHEPHFNP